jgi:hypothetical protein
VNWLVYLKSLPELGEKRVFYPEFPQRVPSGLFAYCEYPADARDEGRFADAYSGTQLLDIYLYQPPLTDARGQRTTPTTPLTDLANRIWLELPKKVTDDLTPALAVAGSWQVARPAVRFSDATFGRYCRLRVSFRIQARPGFYA